MRAAPPLQITVTRFGVWRTSVGVAATVALASLATWALSHARADGWPDAAPIFVAGALAAAATGGAAFRLARMPARTLRWDGRCWWLVPMASTVAAEPIAGDLHAMVDLGAWLLLRFEADALQGRHPPRWIPVQRRGLEPRWHALRCALYSPRPSSLAAAPSPVP